MKISKKDFTNKIMLLQIIWTLFFGLVYSYYPEMGIFSYLPDVLNGVLCIFMFEKMKQGLKLEYIWLIVFVTYVSVSFLWGDMDWYYVISNGRRFITAFIIYYMSSEYMTLKYWYQGLNIMLVAQGINVFATGYQNLVMELHPDFCNGIFGFGTYNNAMQGIFCLIISVVAMVFFLDKKWSIYKMIYAIGTSCVVCAFAEIKAYYILMILVFVIAFLFRCNTPKLRKKIIYSILSVVVLLVIAYKILEVVFPANLDTFFDLSKYIAYEQYGAHGGAGRLSTISYIYKNVFEYDIIKTLFGSGLGGIGNEYAYTIGKLFVSFGIVGLLLFFVWVVYICTRGCIRVKGNSENLILIIMAIMILITMFVWNALFTQVAFGVFWILGSRNVERNTTKKIFEKI